jgi:hypothetical protein
LQRIQKANYYLLFFNLNLNLNIQTHRYTLVRNPGWVGSLGFWLISFF